MLFWRCASFRRFHSGCQSLCIILFWACCSFDGLLAYRPSDLGEKALALQIVESGQDVRVEVSNSPGSMHLSRELQMPSNSTRSSLLSLLEEEPVVTDATGLRWTKCADEGQNCFCNSRIVRFGIANRWIVSDEGSLNTSSLLCNERGFGGLDPAYRQIKECWCRLPSAQDDMPLSNAGVAIVLLSRRPADLRLWLAYHLDYMGVKHVFMDVEDTPLFDEAWQSLSEANKKRVTIRKAVASTGSGRPWDDYTTLQARQLAAMRRAKEACKDLGIEWLLHIDDDELLYVPTHQPIGEILAAIPAQKSQVYINNVEAVYESADVTGEECFAKTSMVNMNAHTFSSYANGKAAVRVSDKNAVPAGPHNWKTKNDHQLNSISFINKTFGSPLWLIHFESCPFSRWVDKYWELGNTSPEHISKIPFPFYRQSISRMQCCRSKQESGSTVVVDGREECTDSALKNLWSSYKTRSNPNLRAEDLMPIVIPWQQIKNSSQRS